MRIKNKIPKLFNYITLILLAFLITACSQEVDLYLKAGERWEITSTQTLALDIIGPIQGEIENISIGLVPGQIAKQVLSFGYNQVVSMAQSRGMQASWSSHKNLGTSETAFNLRISGKGWEQLNSLMQPPDLSSAGQNLNLKNYWPVSLQIASLDNNQLQFRMTLPEGVSNTGLFFPYTFRLHGSRIISHNADYVQGGTATWVNPQGTLEAVITPGSAINLTLVLSILGVLLLLILLIILISRTRNKREVYDYLNPDISDDWLNYGTQEPQHHWPWRRKKEDDYFQ